MMPPYVYRPLENPAEQIRLLTVLPSRRNDSLIETRFSTHPIPASNASRRARFLAHVRLPSYYAVSYVWGAEAFLGKSQKILLDGQEFPVTENVHAALREFRSSNTVSLRLWIDSICINQSDNLEKSGQIRIMREVYHLAFSVIIWLGKETPESARAVRFIKDLCQMAIVREAENAVLAFHYPERNHDTSINESVNRSEAYRAAVLRVAFTCVQTFGLSVGRTFAIALDVWLNLSRDNHDYRLPMTSWMKPIYGAVASLDQWWARHSNMEEHNDLQNRERRRPVDEYQKSIEAIVTQQVEAKVKGFASWKPSRRRLRRAQKEDFVEMSHLIEKTFIANTGYFHRMWTLQEASVGFSVFIQYGGSQLGLHHLLRTICYLNRTCLANTSAVYNVTKLQRINVAWNCGQRPRLRELLYDNCERECLNPRDKIFASIGLIRDRADARLRPDYGKPVSEVYVSAALYIIVSELSLDIICSSRSEQRLEGLASWVPDFRYFGRETSLTSLIDVSGRTNIYNVSMSEAPQDLVNRLNWRQKLRVTGICLGSVTRLSETQGSDDVHEMEEKWRTSMMEDDTVVSQYAEALAGIPQLLNLYSKFYHNTEERSLSWSQNPDAAQLMSDLTKKLLGQDETSLSLLSSYLLTLLCGRISSTSRCRPSNLHRLMGAACERDDSSNAALEALCTALGAGMRHRRYMATAESYHGAAPETAILGDEVFVLVGCSVPVVLRQMPPEPNEYVLVGECYVNGFMDGEAVQLRDQGALAVRDLILG